MHLVFNKRRRNGKVEEHLVSGCTYGGRCGGDKVYEGKEKKILALWELYKQTISLKTRRFNMQRRKKRREKRLQASRKKRDILSILLI